MQECIWLNMLCKCVYNNHDKTAASKDTLLLAQFTHDHRVIQEVSVSTWTSKAAYTNMTLNTKQNYTTRGL